MSENPTKTILIIDDSPEDLEFYSRLLSRADSGQSYEVLTAQTAQQGLQTFETHTVDCTIVDFNLPDGDGLSTVSALQERKGKKVPVIILTGEHSQVIQAKAARSGALDYVVKDAVTSASQLERVILKAISWSGSARA